MTLKKIITLSIVATIIAVVLITAITDNGITTPKDETSYFTVTYKITYNKITLAQAAELEKKIRSEHEDACSVKIDLKPVNPDITFWIDDPMDYGWQYNRETMPNWYLHNTDLDLSLIHI